MSVVLHTAANFTVVRQIANHTDSTTYYVRAVIRNAYTDVILATLDLEDKGDQRFKKDWKVPNDPSGEGFYVSIVTSVYSDSNYTTKSENYGDEENTYLVEDRVLAGRGAGGGGADSRTVRRILKEELENFAPEPVKLPSFPKDRTDEVLKQIKELAVSLKPEKPEKVDLFPIQSALLELYRAIDKKEVTPATDLAPVLAAVRALESENGRRHSSLIQIVNTIEDTLPEAVASSVAPVLADVVKSSTFQIGATTATMQAPKRAPTQTPEEDEEPELDLTALAS